MYKKYQRLSLKRARYNAAMITTKQTKTGDDYSQIPEVYIIYISEFDFLGKGKTAYHIDKVLRETGTVVDDGLHELFVNTVIDDGSKTADLMSCFTKKLVNNANFPRFSSRVKELKDTEGGASAMCKVMEHYERIAREEGIAKGREEGREDNLLSNLRNLMHNMRLTAEQAMDALSVPEENRSKYLAVLTAQV